MDFPPWVPQFKVLRVAVNVENWLTDWYSDHHLNISPLFRCFCHFFGSYKDVFSTFLEGFSKVLMAGYQSCFGQPVLAQFILKTVFFHIPTQTCIIRQSNFTSTKLEVLLEVNIFFKLQLSFLDLAKFAKWSKNTKHGNSIIRKIFAQR